MAMRPVAELYRITQSFRANATIYNVGAGHGAVDYGTPLNTPVVASEDGVVEFEGFAYDLEGSSWEDRWYQIRPARGDTRTGGGLMIRLRNDIGSRWHECHLNRTIVDKGQRVRKGQIIGYTGNTGSSTGPHLHASLHPPRPNWRNGFFGSIDPAPYLTERFAPIQAISWQGSPTAGKGGATAPAVTLPVYKLDHRTSPLYTPQASVPRVYGRARKVTGICVHWWNTPDKAGSHDGTASYLARAGGNTSAHYVVSPGRVTQLVAPQHAAWHAGSGQGNATTIGIECDPRDIPGTLPTVAALIRDLEKTYGSLRIYKHSDWTSTSCPGDYAARIPELINLINNPATVSTQAAPQQTKDWFDMATREELREEIQGSINHMFHRGTKEGAPVMERLSAEMRGSTLHVLPQIVKGILAALVPGRGKAKGDMAVSETLGWDRHSRAHTEAQLSGISRDLDLVLIALAAQQKAETTVTVEEN